MHDFENCYDVLGLTSGADRTAIRRAYAQLAKIHRPDSSPEKFQELRYAYERALALLDQSTQPNSPNITIATEATELTTVPPQEVFERLPSSPIAIVGFSDISWPEYLTGKKFAPQSKVDVSAQQLEIENFKKQILKHLADGNGTNAVEKIASEMFSSEPLVNIELRLATEQWLIELGANDDRVSNTFMQWIADQCGITETAESSTVEPIRIAFQRKLTNLYHVARIKASAANDRNSAESMVIYGASYFKLIRQLFQPRQPNARHKIDALMGWLQNQYPSLDNLIDQPTALRWNKLRGIPTISPLVLVISLACAIIGLLKLLPHASSATRTFVGIMILAGSLPIALSVVKTVEAISNALAERIGVGAPYSLRFGVLEIGPAFVSLACLPLYKQYPGEVFYLGIALAFVTLVHANLNGLLHNHLLMPLNQFWPMCLGFLVLSWLAYVGMGGLSDVKHPLGFLGLLPVLLSASLALYNVFWQSAAISRDGDHFLYLKNKRLMQPKPIWLWIIILYLNLTGMNQVFISKVEAAAIFVEIANLWLFYCTISIVGIQSLKQNHAVLLYVFFVVLGAIFLGNQNTFILPGSFAVSVISTGIIGEAIWRTFLRPWLAAKI
jgi:hypothetical protein